MYAYLPNDLMRCIPSWMLRFSTLICLILLALAPQANAANLLAIDLRDVRDFTSPNPVMRTFVKQLEKCGACWPKGVVYTPYGADRNFEVTHENTVFFSYFETYNPNAAGFSARVVGLMRVGPELFVRKLNLRFSAAGNIEVLDFKDVSAAVPGWKITIGALQRALVLENSAIGFRLIMPAVIGGFTMDESELKLPPRRTQMKKTASNGSVSNIFRRTNPTYYQGYPFLQLLNSNGVYTGYGIHAPMDPGVMKRGFWSTGCIRIRMHELYPLFYIVDSIENQFVFDVSAVVNPNLTMTHPYPLWDDAYKRVDRLKPMGEDGLSQMEIIEGRPPLHNLKP